MNPTKTHEPVNPRRSLGLPFTGWFAILLLTIYPLSTGPVLRLWPAGISNPTLMGFYAPIIFLADHCEPFGDFLGWYVFDLWGNPFPKM